MAHKQEIELGVYDVATLLVGLAGQLRRDSLALDGLAHTQGDPEDGEVRALNELSGGLERVATILEGIRVRLCRSCMLIEVKERMAFAPYRLGGNRKIAGK